MNACSDCDKEHWGPECSRSCNCLSVDTLCHGTTGCAACPEGWTGGGDCSENIDECDVSINPCGNHSNCTDTKGSYTCECHQGYERVMGGCKGRFILGQNNNYKIVKDLFVLQSEKYFTMKHFNVHVHRLTIEPMSPALVKYQATSPIWWHFMFIIVIHQMALILIRFVTRAVLSGYSRMTMIARSHAIEMVFVFLVAGHAGSSARSFMLSQKIILRLWVSDPVQSPVTQCPHLYLNCRRAWMIAHGRSLRSTSHDINVLSSLMIKMIIYRLCL